MGNASGKHRSEGIMDISGHAETLSEREASAAWYRYGVAVTDVYDVVEVLGQGHMGEVFTVRRKVTGHHTDRTRERAREGGDDLREILKKREKEEGRGGADALSLSQRSRRSDRLSMSQRSRRSLRKATSKARSKLTKKKGDDAHGLHRFIDEGGQDEPEQHEPPARSSGSALPLKSALREGGGRFSGFSGNSGCSTNSERSVNGGSDVGPRHHSAGDMLSTSLHSNHSNPGNGYYRRTSSGSGAEQIINATKGVHFQRTFAVKTILTSRVNKDQLQELVNEIMIMRKLDHPFVLKLYEVYHVKRKLWLVTELLAGGDLSSRKLNEQDTKNVIEQVLRALVYLHRMGIVHRDIKLENVMYENHSRQATVRLIDFGLSRTFDNRTSAAADYARTPYTMSPEAARGEGALTAKTDVWAVGVIAFIMLSGQFPFIKINDDTKDQKKMTKLKKADFYFGITWNGRNITQQAREFVKGCLQADPDKRWTAKEALQNLQENWGPEVDRIWDEWLEETKKNKKPEFVPPQDPPEDEEEEEGEEGNGDPSSTTSGPSWLEENDDDEAPPPAFDNQARAQFIKKHVQKVVRKKNAEAVDELKESVTINMDEIERYTKFGFLKKTILITMANTMDRGDVGKLRELFLKSDTLDTGTITLQELIAAFRTVSPEVDEKRVERLFQGIDRDRSGHIHYAEFLAALAESHGLVTLDRLTEAFDRIDTDGKGYIAHEDLKSILGKDYDKEKVDQMIEEGDFNKNNKIDYEELLQLMFSDPVRGAELAGSVAVSPVGSFGDDVLSPVVSVEDE